MILTISCAHTAKFITILIFLLARLVINKLNKIDAYRDREAGAFLGFVLSSCLRVAV